MAFVFLEQKKTIKLVNHSDKVGPGSYQVLNKNHKEQRSNVPFGISQKREIIMPKNIDSVPGPGAYYIQNNTKHEKIVLTTAKQDIKIIQAPKVSSMFKSTANRFIDSVNNNPGPGSYYRKQTKSVYEKVPINKQIYQKNNIILKLMKINKYQSIPSIPSNMHAFGYTENQNQQLELNKNPNVSQHIQKGQIVGPGTYDPFYKEEKTRGISWHKESKNHSVFLNQKNIKIGPGQYQLDFKAIPYYKLKQTSNFISKSNRIMDQRKGAIANKFILQKLMKQNLLSQQNKTQISGVKSQNIQDSTNPDSDQEQDQIEFIDDVTPGPGYYNIDQVNNTIYSDKKKTKIIKSFGVKANRFQQQINHNPGPGQYMPNINMKKSKNKNKIVPFNSQQTRIQKTQNQNQNNIGPGSYQPRNTLEDKLIFKIQRGYRGQFGSTENRFRQVKFQQIPGPGSYDFDIENINEFEESKKNTQNSVFKSRIPRTLYNKVNNNPAPGAYDLDINNIGSKITEEEQEDPDLIIKKPPFNVGEKRFKQQKIQENEQDDIIQAIHEKEKLKKKRQNKKPFNIGIPRFSQNQNEHPGPGQYDDSFISQWNKRTYNIRFANI